MTEESKTEELKNPPVEYEDGSTMPFNTRTGSMEIRTVGDLMYLSKIFAKTDMVPDAYKGKPASIFVAATTGFRVGFTDILMSLQSIAVVNGNPSIYGKGALGLIKRSGKLTKHVECFILPDKTQVDHYNGPKDLGDWPDELTAVCEMVRENGDPVRGMFSVADAKRMGKWNKTSKSGRRTVWQNHPAQMLMWRARHKVFDQDWSDVLCGLLPYEVAIDMVPLDKEGAEATTYVPKGDTYEMQDEQNDEEYTPGEQEQKIYTNEDVIDDFKVIFKTEHFPMMDTFLELVSANSDQTVEETMRDALDDIKVFGMMYGEWSAAQKKAEDEQSQEEESPFQDVPPEQDEIQDNGNNKDYNPEPEEEPESSKAKPKVPVTGASFYEKPEGGAHSPFRQEWNLKNKSNFIAYILKNKSKFEECKIHNPDDYQAAQDKFKKFYPDKMWPIFPVDKDLEDKSTLAEVKPGMIRLFTNSDELSPEQKQYKMRALYPYEYDLAIKKLKFDRNNLGPSAINVIERVICDVLKGEVTDD